MLASEVIKRYGDLSARIFMEGDSRVCKSGLLDKDIQDEASIFEKRWWQRPGVDLIIVKHAPPFRPIKDTQKQAVHKSDLHWFD